jgi:flagellar motility protein MotE (MotC chaperone)
MIRPHHRRPEIAKGLNQRVWRNLHLAIIASFIVFFSCASLNASETKSMTPEKPKASTPVTAPLPKDDYCANIANFASDARYALQVKTLEDLQKQIDQKITLLEAKRAENEDFLKRRDEAVKGTQKGLIDIFAKMKPDVAAAQFEILDVETSASILKQLNARVASTILNEMKAPIAAAITIKMAEPVASSKAGSGT